MSTDNEGEELVFDDPQPVIEKETAKAEAAAPTEEAPAPKAEEPRTDASQPAAAEENTPNTPEKKKSAMGMAIAAALAISVIASLVSAVQAWRAASFAADAATINGDKALSAQLAEMRKLLEQQRNALDSMATVKPASHQTIADSAQINALATAVRANQDIAERLPTQVMSEVDNRLDRIEARLNARAAKSTATVSKTAKASSAKVSAQSVKPNAKVAVRQAPVSAKAAPPPPSGDPIRYP